MSERKHQYNCALNDPAPIIAGESARMGDINRAMNQCTCDAHQPFTSEEIKSLPSRVLIHGTPDGNKATLAWDDYSRLFATAAAAVERGVRETPDEVKRLERVLDEVKYATAISSCGFCHQVNNIIDEACESD